MTTPSTDSDSALAALIATLDPVAFPHDDYVRALHDAGGYVQRAAETLLLSSGSAGPSTNGKKRRLEHYFMKPKPQPSKRSVSGSASTSASASASSLPSVKKSPPASPSPRKDTSVDRAASASQWATLLKPSSTSTAAPDKPSAPRSAPVFLSSPSSVATADIPLALLPSPLTPELAAVLYHEMLAESPSWPRNKWYLAGREVESNHQATSYARPGGGFGASVGVPYYYAARKYDAKPYTPALERAAQMVEDAVNSFLDTRARYAWEYRGRWRANMCAANRYDGAQATVGWHADQMTYLGPYPTIASLSLGTPRAFRLRQTEAADEAFASGRPTRTYEVTLGHNTLCLMTPGCQERYKHTVPPQRALDTFRPGWDAEGNPLAAGEGPSYTTRINITFRFYRDDFHPSPGQGPLGPRSGTPICKCGIPTLLRADQKAKARGRMATSASASGGTTNVDGTAVLRDDMAFFWQCQSPGTTGQIKGCGFFKILNMRGEGRGPCFGYGGGEQGGDEVEVEGEPRPETQVESRGEEQTETAPDPLAEGGGEGAGADGPAL